MFDMSCPYCYHRVNRYRLWYQCDGRGSPGHAGCKPAVKDADRERETGYNQPVRPSYPPAMKGPVAVGQSACPKCFSASNIRVCPRCHTPLPLDFGKSNSPLIAMVGAKGTGKSVFLAVLAHELQVSLRRRFQAAVRLIGESNSGNASQKWLRDTISALYDNKTLPPGTAAAQEGRREPLVFEWRRRSRLGAATTYLSFYDTAGEDLNTLGSAQDLAYLDAADALILLLDPFMLPQARDRIHVPSTATSDLPTIDILGQMTDALRLSRKIPARKRIPMPVAVAFAKIDAFFPLLGNDDPLLRPPAATQAVYDETAGRSTHEHVRALLEDWGGDDIDSYLEQNYKSYRYFAVSALGAPPDYSTFSIESGGVRPYRVDEPLLWLLSRFGVVDAKVRT